MHFMNENKLSTREGVTKVCSIRLLKSSIVDRIENYDLSMLFKLLGQLKFGMPSNKLLYIIL